MKIHGKYLIVLLSVCGMIVSGVGLLTNVAGLFFTPMATDLHLKRGAAALTLTISNLAYATGGMFSGKIITEKNFRKSAATLTALLAGSTILMASAQNAVLLYVCSALRGFAGGMLGFVLSTTILNAWFHECNGLATSIAMSTSGIAGALFSPVISAVITTYGWRKGYVCTGILMILFNLPLILFLPSLKPEKSGYVPLGGNTVTESISSDAENSSGRVSGFLFVAVFLFALLGCAVTAVPQHFPAIAESFAMNAAGTMMLSAGMLANTFGKIIMGFLTDHIGSRHTILLYAVLVTTGCVFLLTMHSPVMMLLSAALIGLSYSLGTVGVVMLTKDTFGLKGYGKTYPTISFGGTVGNALYSSIIGFIYDAEGNYDLTLILTVVFMIIVILCTMICRQRGNRETVAETA